MDEQEYLWDGDFKISFLNDQGYVVTRIFFNKQLAIDFLHSLSVKTA
jgi:hypothetical protein